MINKKEYIKDYYENGQLNHLGIYKNGKQEGKAYSIL